MHSPTGGVRLPRAWLRRLIGCRATGLDAILGMQANAVGNEPLHTQNPPDTVGSIFPFRSYFWLCLCWNVTLGCSIRHTDERTCSKKQTEPGLWCEVSQVVDTEADPLLVVFKTLESTADIVEISSRVCER